MKACKVCGKPLTEKALDIQIILNAKEKAKIKKLRKKQEVCAKCKMQMLILNIL